MMRRVIPALLAGACAGGAPGGEWGGTIETLPNGVVRVVNPAAGLWERGRPWRLVPELAIGAAEGPGADVFGAVLAVEAGAGGRIYVLDRQANELRIFGPDGVHIRTVGRSGSGPGEYANANGLLWIAPDTLVVVDQRGNRYSILTAAGEYVRSVPRGLGFFAWAFAGGYDGGTLYEATQIPPWDSPRPALLGTRLAGPVPAPAGEGGAVAPGVRVDTILLTPPAAPAFQAFSVQTERGGMSMGVPFAPRAVWRVDGFGGVWHGHGGEPRVVRSTLAGDTLLEIVLRLEPAPVTQDELDEWLAQPGVARFREMGGRLDVGRIPRTKPFFDDLVVDPDGHLWVSLPAGPEDVAFGIVDPDGRYLGRLDATGLRRDAFVPPVVRNGRLHIVGRDDLDVQRVYVFRIER